MYTNLIPVFGGKEIVSDIPDTQNNRIEETKATIKTTGPMTEPLTIKWKPDICHLVVFTKTTRYLLQKCKARLLTTDPRGPALPQISRIAEALMHRTTFLSGLHKKHLTK